MSNSAPIIATTRAVPLPAAALAHTDHVAGPFATLVPGARVVIGPAQGTPSREALADHVRGATVIVSMFNDRIDAELLDAAGPQLKGVCNFAVGFDNIDLAACRARQVVVCNCPDAVTEGTANLAWGLILAVARFMRPADAFVRSGEFARAGNPGINEWLGMHLTGQRMLIVGAGRIGKAVAQRALAFGMRILYTARSRHVDFELAPLAAERVELEHGLRQADVVSVHTPLTAETHHLLNASRIAMLKPTAIVINTSRGPVIDEAALVAALKARRIWGAGLDVFEDEPRIHPELASLDNVALTPHIGSAERYWRQVMTEVVLANAIAIINGMEPPNRVA